MLFFSSTAKNSGMLSFVHLFVADAGTYTGTAGMRSQENGDDIWMLADRKWPSCYLYT